MEWSIVTGTKCVPVGGGVLFLGFALAAGVLAVALHVYVLASSFGPPARKPVGWTVAVPATRR
jgi:hypothetical protein